MGNYMEKKEVKKALAEAKRLSRQKEPIPTKEKEMDIYNEMVVLSEKLKKMLKPSWFVKDVHKGKLRSRKTVKKVKVTKKTAKKKTKKKAKKAKKTKAGKKKKK